MKKENNGQPVEMDINIMPRCKFGTKCRYKDYSCPYQHPQEKQRKPTAETTESAAAETTPEQRSHGDQLPQLDTDHESPAMKESIPKTESRIWTAMGDGSCMYYCVAGKNDQKEAQELRKRVAQYVEETWDKEINGVGIAAAKLLQDLGWTKEQYLRSVLTRAHWGDEPELVFLANITQQRIRIFQDAGEHWQELVQYGKQGPILRLLYVQKRVHYDKIIVKER